MEVREELLRVSSVFQPCEFLGLNSEWKAWQQAPFPTEPSCRPLASLFFQPYVGGAT